MNWIGSNKEIWSKQIERWTTRLSLGRDAWEKNEISTLFPIPRRISWWIEVNVVLNMPLRTESSDRAQWYTNAIFFHQFLYNTTSCILTTFLDHLDKEKDVFLVTANVVSFSPVHVSQVLRVEYKSLPQNSKLTVSQFFSIFKVL